MSDWIEVKQHLPANGDEVMTKIDDHKGILWRRHTLDRSVKR